jgi:hypothetical protein
MALDLSNTANNLIAKLSGDKPGNYQVAVEVGGSEDPITGAWTDGATELTDIDATETKLDNSLIDGINVLSTDRMLLLSPFVSVPDGAYFIVRGDNLSIVSRMPIWNGGALQLQRFIVRSS